MDELQNDGSKTALVLYKKFEDAYKTHVVPLLKEISKEYADDEEVSIMEEDKDAKDFKLQKGLKELEKVLSILVTNPEQVRSVAGALKANADLLSFKGNQNSGNGLLRLTPNSRGENSRLDSEDHNYLKPSPNTGSTNRSRRLDSLATPSARANKPRFGTMLGGFPKG